MESLLGTESELIFFITRIYEVSFCTTGDSYHIVDSSHKKNTVEAALLVHAQVLGTEMKYQ